MNADERLAAAQDDLLVSIASNMGFTRGRDITQRIVALIDAKLAEQQAERGIAIERCRIVPGGPQGIRISDMNTPGGDDGSATRKDAGGRASALDCQGSPLPPGSTAADESAGDKLVAMYRAAVSGLYDDDDPRLNESVARFSLAVDALHAEITIDLRAELDRVAREAHAKGYAEGHEQQMKMRVLDAQERRTGK